MRTEASTTEFLGIEFANLTYETVIAKLDRLSEQGRFSYVVTPNVDHVVMLHDGKDYSAKVQLHEAYRSAAIRLCDSRVLQLLARLRQVELQVVTGSDLTAMLFLGGHLDGKRVAIIGGNEAMFADLNQRFHRTEFVQHVPPMGVLKNPLALAEIEEFIASHPCHYVFLAIGAPQSEIAAYRCLQKGRSQGVALCIGASLEFITGGKKRAPLWMQKVRMEWAFRLLSEPGRLWKRYLITGPKILKIAFFRRKTAL